MSRILSAVLVFALVLGAGAIAQADVSGSFQIDLLLVPENTDTEAVKFNIDFQTNLQVNVTLSGLTFGSDLGFGVTGVEFAVLSVNTQMGALSVDDDFVFAVPFGCTFFPSGISNSANTVGACPGLNVIPIGDADGDNVNDNAVGFVKKRISLELNIAGITITNLAMFEDVDFPDIQGLNPNTGLNDHEHDHFDGSILYDLSGVNNTVDDQTPTFGFGDVISFSGQTVSGITLTGTTALCADGVNYIKKRSWTWEVNEACTAEFGNDFPALEGGAKTPLLFEREILEISGVEIGGVGLSMTTTWRPNIPLAVDIVASFNVLDLADVTMDLRSDNITNLSLDRIDLAVTSGDLSLDLIDFGGDLDIDRYFATFAITLNQNQNPANLTTTIIGVNGVGIVRLDATISVTRGPLSVSSFTRFAGAGDLTWVSTDFSASLSGDVINLDATIQYRDNFMADMSVAIGITF